MRELDNENGRPNLTVRTAKMHKQHPVKLYLGQELFSAVQPCFLRYGHWGWAIGCNCLPLFASEIKKEGRQLWTKKGDGRQPFLLRLSSECKQEQWRRERYTRAAFFFFIHSEIPHQSLLLINTRLACAAAHYCEAMHVFDKIQAAFIFRPDQ